MSTVKIGAKLTCSYCGNEYDADAVHFKAFGKYSDGPGAKCWGCHRLYMQDYQKARREASGKIRSRTHHGVLTVQNGIFTFPLADKQCPRCRCTYARLPELWGSDELCIYCAEDIGVLIPAEAV